MRSMNQLGNDLYTGRTSFPFVGRRKLWFLIAAILVIGSALVPLIRPILTTVIVFQTMGTWNDFMTPSVYISSTNKQTIVLQVFNAISTFTTNWPLFMTVTTIALIPVFVFFIFCQRWIVAGLVAGSVKG